MKRILTPLALACLLAGPSSIHAAAYSGMVVFGDSLSDAGQFAIGSNPIRFTTQVGPTYSYFSSEAFASTSPMLIGEGLGLGSQSASTSALRQALEEVVAAAVDVEQGVPVHPPTAGQIAVAAAQRHAAGTD